QDYPLAIEWIRKAAEQGLPGAQVNLGYCYEKGRGVEKDLAQAKLWYEKAADQGHKKAKNRLKWVREALKKATQDGGDFDFGIYWLNYAEESGRTGVPVTGWYTGREWLVKRLRPGDRIWLFVGGSALGDTQAPHRGYVAQLLVVNGWDDNDEEGGSRFFIEGDADRCVLVTPPLLVDDVFRQLSAPAEQHIGTARQTPFQLDEGQQAALLARLQKERPAVYAVATQR